MIFFCWDGQSSVVTGASPLVLRGLRITVSVNVQITFALVLNSPIDYCGEQNLEPGGRSSKLAKD